MRKKLLSLLLAGAMVLSLCVPCALAAESNAALPLTMNVIDGKEPMHGTTKFKVINWDYEYTDDHYDSEKGVWEADYPCKELYKRVLFRLDPVEQDVEHCYDLPLGTSITLDSREVEIQAWTDSDGDGDGVYEGRLFSRGESWTDADNNGIYEVHEQDLEEEDFADEVLPTSMTGWFVNEDGSGYGPFTESFIVSRNQIEYIGEAPSGCHGVTLTAAYLTEYFGADTLVSIRAPYYGEDDVEDAYYLFYLTGKAADPSILTDKGTGILNEPLRGASVT